MKKLNITWEGIHDSTGYLFSLAKSLSCAVKNSPWAETAEDIIATSGFAFRMWVAADLCPSATSIWGFDGQKPWVESGGFTCDYVGRYWGQEHFEEERRLEAIANIKRSIDSGIPAVSWDIGVPEWGLIIGYDDEAQMLFTLGIDASHADPTSPEYSGTQMPYAQLGMRELPILSVLTITGRSGKSDADILRDTKKLAAFHLRGGEWCDNAKGLAAYPALIGHFEAEDPELALCWGMEYMLGTYGALKYYAWKYFDRMGEAELAALYKAVHEAWQEAFQMKTGQDLSDVKARAKVAALLKSAHTNEIKAVEIMEQSK